MASTEEVISTLLADDYIHSSIQFLIDENMRTVTVPPEGVVLGVTGDKDVNRINFKMVRYYDGLDLSTFQIRINYVNANGDANYYQVTDTTVEDDSILFTWLVSSDAAAYKGTVSFAARLYTVEDTIVKESFNSTVATAEVLEGIIVDEYMPPDAQQDLIALLLSQIDISEGVGKVDTTEGASAHGEIFNDYTHNEATGGFSHAEGNCTTASGANSHAEGSDTTASGYASHAEGSGTTASGFHSHAEGSRTKASSANQHVQGKYNVEDTAGKYAMIIGNGTSDTARSNALTVDWKGNVKCGTINGVDVTQLSSGSGSGVGQVDATEGASNHGEIFNNYENNKATGDHSHAEGSSTTASGYASHAEGYSTASGEYSHAEGYSTTASGRESHAEGYATTASGNYSHAEGFGTTASGNYSHAEGQNTKAIGTYSHAEGYSTKAIGTYSHAEGSYTEASGMGSHVEGMNNTASGEASHAEGYCTKASSMSQHVQGQYNIEDSVNTYAMIIGNGKNSDARSNAFTVDWNGNIRCGKTDTSGNFTTNGTINGIDIVDLAARVAALEGSS